MLASQFDSYNVGVATLDVAVVQGIQGQKVALEKRYLVAALYPIMGAELHQFHQHF